MQAFDYYQAPEQEVFEDIKAKAIELWQTYDDTYGYATGKINRIKDIENVQDNAWYIIAMFDIQNQAKLLSMVNEKTKVKIQEMLAWSKKVV